MQRIRAFIADALREVIVLPITDALLKSQLDLFHLEGGSGSSHKGSKRLGGKRFTPAPKFQTRGEYEASQHLPSAKEARSPNPGPAGGEGKWTMSYGSVKVGEFTPGKPKPSDSKADSVEPVKGQADTFRVTVGGKPYIMASRGFVLRDDETYGTAHKELHGDEAQAVRKVLKDHGYVKNYKRDGYNMGDHAWEKPSDASQPSDAKKPVYKYRATMRPIGDSTVPPGFKNAKPRDDEQWHYGTVEYDHPLTSNELYHLDLVPEPPGTEKMKTTELVEHLTGQPANKRVGLNHDDYVLMDVNYLDKMKAEKKAKPNQKEVTSDKSGNILVNIGNERFRMTSHGNVYAVGSPKEKLLGSAKLRVIAAVEASGFMMHNTYNSETRKFTKKWSKKEDVKIGGSGKPSEATNPSQKLTQTDGVFSVDGYGIRLSDTRRYGDGTTYKWYEVNIDGKWISAGDPFKGPMTRGDAIDAIETAKLLAKPAQSEQDKSKVSFEPSGMNVHVIVGGDTYNTDKNGGIHGPNGHATGAERDKIVRLLTEAGYTQAGGAHPGMNEGGRWVKPKTAKAGSKAELTFGVGDATRIAAWEKYLRESPMYTKRIASMPVEQYRKENGGGSIQGQKVTDDELGAIHDMAKKIYKEYEADGKAKDAQAKKSLSWIGDILERVEKSQVKGHYRTVNGKKVWVKAHDDKRTKKNVAPTKRSEHETYAQVHGGKLHVLDSVAYGNYGREVTTATDNPKQLTHYRTNKNGQGLWVADEGPNVNDASYNTQIASIAEFNVPSGNESARRYMEENIPKFAKTSAEKSFAAALPVSDAGPIRFQVGNVAISDGAQAHLMETGDDPMMLVMRHAMGDWSGMNVVDQQLNAVNAASKQRVQSSFETANGAKIWVITDPEHTQTMIIQPQEY